MGLALLRLRSRNRQGLPHQCSPLPLWEVVSLPTVSANRAKRKKTPRFDQRPNRGACVSGIFWNLLPRPALCRIQVDYGLIAALKDSDSAFL